VLGSDRSGHVDRAGPGAGHLRYHLCLGEPWHLELQQRRLVFQAPVIRPRLPPAIHTDQLQSLAAWGWVRGATSGLPAERQQALTPTLIQHAGDVRHQTLVRLQCQDWFREFVPLWLEREGKGGGSPTSR